MREKREDKGQRERRSGLLRRLPWLVVMCVAYFTATGYASTSECQGDKRTGLLYQLVDRGVEESKGEQVWICTGKYARTYHLTPRCHLLGNCKGEIVSVSETKARERGRALCKICAKRKKKGGGSDTDQRQIH